MAAISDQRGQTNVGGRPQQQQQQRPQHRRNKSSKFLKSLVSSKSRPVSPETTPSSSAHVVQTTGRTQTVPLLPPDHPHASTSRVLGERQSNVQSPPASPSKRGDKPTGTGRHRSRSPTKPENNLPKKTKSTTSLSAMFGKINRSSRDLTSYAPQVHQFQGQEKENATPPDSAVDPVDTPIWAQFVSPSSSNLPESEEGRNSSAIKEEISRYTPQDYSPGKQRNFNGGTTDQPSLRPTIRSRPQSTVITSTEGFMGGLGRKVSNARASMDTRRSEDSSGRMSKEDFQRASVERPKLLHRHSDRQVSGSSAEQPAPKERLTIAKRGTRVMAAVAALQGKAKGTPVKEEAALDEKTVDAEFEAVLASRNVPEAMRERMRTLTLRVKADFVRQDQGASKNADGSAAQTPAAAATQDEAEQRQQMEDDPKMSKRSRSRTFTFSKGDKKGSDRSPSKKPRSRSKGRSLAINIPMGRSSTDLTTPTTPTGSSWGRKHAAPAVGEYITYLRKHQDPREVEVGRLHKLRILLRNETVAWVDGFISQGGMAEVVGLLHRLMDIEWREEHEDQLLHETLLCLKGLCTTERALAELAQVADRLFPALFGMLFDQEKKGPAEYTTRTIIVNVLFTYLAAPLNSPAIELEERARKILTYLAEPQKAETDRPVAFVLGMHVPRPYKSWCQEVSNVTKEVFWIFLHHLNVVPQPKRPGSAGSDTNAPLSAEASAERERTLAATYTQRHFPGLRPPVPAAPYIGGVEWDATTYLAAHLDLLNGLIASLPTASARNLLRDELQASGFEKTMGTTLRTCKEKFYSGVHDGLRAWVAAAAEDGWETRLVREGPAQEEQAARARSASPNKKNKKKDAPPQLTTEVGVEALPRLDVDLGGKKSNVDDDDGWLG